MSAVKWRPIYLGLNVLKELWFRPGLDNSIVDQTLRSSQ